MGYRRCCVPNCGNKREDVKLHKLPDNPARQKEWLKRIACPKLNSLPAAEVVKFHICQKHFEVRFLSKSRLRYSAYPTLFSASEMESGIPTIPTIDDYKENALLDHGYNIMHYDHSYSKPSNYTYHQPESEKMGDLVPSGVHVNAIADATSQKVVASTSMSIAAEVHHYATQDDIRHDVAPTSITIDGSRIVTRSSGGTPIVLVPPPRRMLKSSPINTDIMNMPVAFANDAEPEDFSNVASTSTAMHNQDIANIATNALPSHIEIIKDYNMNTEVSMDIELEDLEMNINPSSPIITSLKATNAGVSPVFKTKRIINRKVNLTPRCKKLYSHYLKAKRQTNYAIRAKKALKFSKQKGLEEGLNKLNPIAKTLLLMQIKQCTKAKQGRRFTLEEKMIGLSIMKQSPKAYKFLQKIFILPSKTTLKNMVSSLNLKSGINPQLFNVIENEVSNWDTKKRLCTIMFDEMSLEPALVYSKKDDKIDGFVELSTKCSRISDHALVFILRGAVHKWQQPIAFYFSEGAVSSQELTVILKDIVSAVVKTGLDPIALVCDQGSSFQSSLKKLQDETREMHIRSSTEVIDDVINISGASLNIIYDPPHLIKGIRNNFINKNIKCENKISKWDDIVDVYKTDCEHAEMRQLYKLNDECVIPGKIKKMKVKNCVKVLSHTVAAALMLSSAYGTYTDGRPVSKTLKNTAEIVSFFDKLFDSVNGSSTSLKITKGKKLRTAVTSKSEHHTFWKNAVKKLESMHFIHNGTTKSVPSLKNWVKTLKSFQRVWQVLKGKNISIMRPKYFNSDPIENFFGRVRAYNFRNNDPTCHTFTNTFKSLLITGLIKFHSQSYNCEDDTCTQLLKVQSLFENSNEISTLAENNVVTAEVDLNYESINSSFHAQAARERLKVHSRAYTAGWVARKIKSKLNCHTCCINLTTNDVGDIHQWISHREYEATRQHKLNYPSEYVVIGFANVIQETNKYLESNSHNNYILKEIKSILLSKYSFDFFKTCDTHGNLNTEYFMDISIKLCIFNWCNIINKILKGTDISRLQKNLPPMQKKAFEKYKKKLKNKSLGK